MVPRESMTAKYDRTRRLETAPQHSPCRRELRLEFCQWRALQTRECEVEHVAIFRAAILIDWAIEDCEAKQVHSVIAAIDFDRWGPWPEGARATRYRPDGIDRDVVGVQEHAGSPAARIEDGVSSYAYAAVTACDRSDVVQEDIAAIRARVDLDTGSAIAAKPDTKIRVAIKARETNATKSSDARIACGPCGAAVGEIAAVAARSDAL